MKISKGKTGGVGVMLVGVGMIIKGIAEGDYSKMPEAFALLSTGLGIFGIRVAQDKP